MKTIYRTSIILILLLLSVSYTQAQKSVAYKSEEGKFSIKFPGEFKENITEKESAKTVKIQCELEKSNYFASYSLHKVDIDDPLEMAEVSLESFTEAIHGVVVTRTEWKIKKNEGLKALIDLPDNGAKLEYRVILVGNIQYQLIVIAVDGAIDKKKANAFFKSFKLKK